MTGVDLDSEPPIEPDRQLGLIVRSLRKESNQSLANLTASSGVDESTLAQIEAGTFDPPWPMIEAIARGLDISIARLAGAVVAERPRTGFGQAGSMFGMAWEGLLFEIDRAVEDLRSIDANPDPAIGDAIAAVAERLEEARAAYLSTGAAVTTDPGRDLRLSPEADDACVALVQFATSDSVATAAHVAFSADLTKANPLFGETRAHQAAFKGITVARAPASSSIEEARANLVAGLAWQLEWSRGAVGTAKGIAEPFYGRRFERIQRHLFGGANASSRN